MNETSCVLIKISLTFVSKGPIDNNPVLVRIMAGAPNRRQALMWTNADTFHWCKNAAQRGDLIFPAVNKFLWWYFGMMTSLVLLCHYNDVIMGTIASQVTSNAIVYSTVCSDADQRKHQSSVSLAFVRGIHRKPVNSPHKWPVTREMFPFHDIIMQSNFSSKFMAHSNWSNYPFYVPIIYIYIYTIKPIQCHMLVNVCAPGVARGPFYFHGLNLIPTWISNHMAGNVFDEIAYPFPNFNGAAVEVWEWISNFIPHFIMDVITYPCWD